MPYVIPHDELNSLITVGSFPEHGFSIGIADAHSTGEPRFRMYNSTHPCDATKAIDISLLRAKAMSCNESYEDYIPYSITMKALAGVLNGPHVIRPLTRYQCICALWNFQNDFITDKDAEDGECFQRYIAGEFDTPSNMDNPRYIPSTYDTYHSAWSVIDWSDI